MVIVSKFLFGAGIGDPKSFHSGGVGGSQMTLGQGGENVCVLSIDGGARSANGVLAAAALVRLEGCAVAARGQQGCVARGLL
ncbi:hypothetical protein ABZP36_030353 [Zizania latifolia]